MKKVLTVLTIIAIVAGVAFAASEEHKIKIKADVDGVVPAFQMNVSTVTTNLPAEGAKAVEFKDGGSYTPNSTTATAVDTGWKLDAGGTVTVTVKLANEAKQKQSYTLTFSDGEFKAVMRNGVSGFQTPSIAATAATSAVKGTSTITASGKVLTVNFNGSKATKDVALGTATYTYTADDTIDPGTYYADIVMTVATV